jgi:hypothetical protein
MAFASGSAEVVPEGGMRSTWAIGGQEVREVIEGLVKKIWKEVKGVELEGWFRVMPYDVAMDVVSCFHLSRSMLMNSMDPTSQIPGSRCM